MLRKKFSYLESVSCTIQSHCTVSILVHTQEDQIHKELADIIVYHICRMLHPINFD